MTAARRCKGLTDLGLTPQAVQGLWATFSRSWCCCTDMEAFSNNPISREKGYGDVVVVVGAARRSRRWHTMLHILHATAVCKRDVTKACRRQPVRLDKFRTAGVVGGLRRPRGVANFLFSQAKLCSPICALLGVVAASGGRAARGVAGGLRLASPSATRCTTARSCHAPPYSRQQPVV